MKYKRGDIVWIKFPFSDASANKLRPALIISGDAINKTGDYLLMQITTRLRADVLSLPLQKNDFKEEPLLKLSELRLHKVFILNERLIEGKITAVRDSFMQIVAEKLLILIS